MPRYRIIPTDQSYSSAEIVSIDPAGVLGIIDRLECKEADILQDGVYAFSAFLNERGVWTIFDRAELRAKLEAESDLTRAV